MYCTCSFLVLVNLTLLNLYNCVSVRLEFVSQSCRMHFVALSKCECVDIGNASAVAFTGSFNGLISVQLLLINYPTLLCHLCPTPNYILLASKF